MCVGLSSSLGRAGALGLVSGWRYTAARHVTAHRSAIGAPRQGPGRTRCGPGPCCFRTATRASACCPRWGGLSPWACFRMEVHSRQACDIASRRDWSPPPRPRPHSMQPWSALLSGGCGFEFCSPRPAHNRRCAYWRALRLRRLRTASPPSDSRLSVAGSGTSSIPPLWGLTSAGPRYVKARSAIEASRTGWPIDHGAPGWNTASPIKLASPRYNPLFAPPSWKLRAAAPSCDVTSPGRVTSASAMLSHPAGSRFPPIERIS